MKHDQNAFQNALNPAGAAHSAAAAAAAAYSGDVADRVRRFLPMVRRLAWHAHGSGRPGIEVDDLMQAGLVALTECAQKHEGPGEDGFAAYAKMRVRGAMVDLVRRSLPISRGAADRRRRVREKEHELIGTLGRNPTPAELAEALDITENELARMRASSEPLHFSSIDEVYSDHDPAFADNEPDSLELLQSEELREQVIEAITALPERLKLVIQLYFVEELNLAEIAEVLSVSIPRIHQLKAQALKKLRQSLEGVDVDVSLL